MIAAAVRGRRWLAAACGAAAVGGCALPRPVGLSAPAGGTHAHAVHGSGDGATPPRGATGPEIPTPPGPLEHGLMAPTPQAALIRFGATYINWNAGDVVAHLRELARWSVGQARTAMALEASQTAADPEIAQAGIANSGRVEAVASLGAGRYVVVTRELTTATNSSAYAGLAPSWHVALATVDRRGGGWVLSGWSPQS